VTAGNVLALPSPAPSSTATRPRRCPHRQTMCSILRNSACWAAWNGECPIGRADAGPHDLKYRPSPLPQCWVCAGCGGWVGVWCEDRCKGV
jgi:hypothetical protein